MNDLNRWSLSISFFAIFVFQLSLFGYHQPDFNCLAHSNPSTYFTAHNGSLPNNSSSFTVRAPNVIGAAAFAVDCVKYLFKAFDTGKHVVTIDFHTSFAQRDPEIYRFFSLAVAGSGSGLQSIPARLAIINFDISKIPSGYQSAFQSIKENLTQLYCNSNGQLRDSVAYGHLGTVFDQFLQSYFDHNDYMTALNALGDNSARAIFEYHQSSRIGHAFNGTRIAFERAQTLAAKSSSTIQNALSNGYNQTVSKLIDCCNRNDFDQARTYLQPGDAVMQRIYEHAHNSWHASQYNEFGVLRKYETDRIWQGLSSEIRNQFKHNPAQLSTLNKLLGAREQFREMVYAKYGIDRFNHSEAVHNTIEDVIDLQTKLTYNIRSGIDFMIMKSEHPDVSNSFFDPTSGILNDFKSDPIIWDLRLDNAQLAQNEDMRHCANYFLAIRASNAPDAAKSMAAKGLEALSNQLHGNSSNTADFLGMFNEIAQNYPHVMGQDYYEHKISSYEFRQLIHEAKNKELLHLYPADAKEWEYAFKNYCQDSAAKTTAHFSVSQEAQLFLHDNQIPVTQYENARGNSLQLQLHKGFVQNINEHGKLHVNPRYSATREFRSELGKINHIGIQKTRQNEIVTGARILTFCRAGIEYVKAVGDGVLLGAQNTALAIKDNPIGFAATAAAQLYAGSALVTFQVLNATYQLGGIAADKLYTTDFKNLSFEKIVYHLENVGTALKDHVSHIPTPQEIKKLVATGTHLYLDYKLTKALSSCYQHALKYTHASILKLKEYAQKRGLAKFAYPESVAQYQKFKEDLTIKEFTSIINVTKHGIKRLLERKFTPQDVLKLITEPDFTRTQLDGCTVLVKQINEGKYNILIFHPLQRKVVTALKGIDIKSINNLGKNYGWKL